MLSDSGGRTITLKISNNYNEWGLGRERGSWGLQAGQVEEPVA